MVDPTLEPTKRPPNTCYAGVPARANRSAHGIAAACTLRNWLGMWSLRTAQTSAEPHLALIDCPALIINAEQDTGVYPSDARRIHDAGFPRPKRIEEFDFDANKAINPALIHQLATSGWVKAGHPLCLIGDTAPARATC